MTEQNRTDQPAQSPVMPAAPATPATPTASADDVVYDNTPRLMLRLDSLQGAAVSLAEQQAARLINEAEQHENRGRALRSEAQQTMVAIIAKVFVQHEEEFPKDTDFRIEKNEQNAPSVILWVDKDAVEAPATPPAPTTPTTSKTPPSQPVVRRGAMRAPPIPVRRPGGK